MRSEYRTYATHYSNGVVSRELSTWSQRRCVSCQRFLGKLQKYYCSECAKKVEDVQTKLSNKRLGNLRTKSWRVANRERENSAQRRRRLLPEVKEENRFRTFVRRHADELEVGQIV